MGFILLRADIDRDMTTQKTVEHIPQEIGPESYITAKCKTKCKYYQSGKVHEVHTKKDPPSQF